MVDELTIVTPCRLSSLEFEKDEGGRDTEMASSFENIT